MADIYIVSTPIGNLEDITLRAIEVLQSSEVIVCEDTRVTKKILDKYNIIPQKLFVLNEYNEDTKLSELLNQINFFEKVSLVSDAGTPLVSDPGYKFIREAIKKGNNVIPVPGASALLAALVVSSLPTNSFTFLGFLPKSIEKGKRILFEFMNSKRTVIIYESPHRIVKTLELLGEVFGDIYVSVSRELTKKFEENTCLKISEHLKIYNSRKPKGEFTLCFNPKAKLN